MNYQLRSINVCNSSCYYMQTIRHRHVRCTSKTTENTGWWITAYLSLVLYAFVSIPDTVTRSSFQFRVTTDLRPTIPQLMTRFEVTLSDYVCIKWTCMTTHTSMSVFIMASCSFKHHPPWRVARAELCPPPPSMHQSGINECKYMCMSAPVS